MTPSILSISNRDASSLGHVQNMPGRWQFSGAMTSSLIKRSIPWIVASIVVAALVARVLKTYQLQQPVECKFGNIKEDHDAAHAFYKQAVKLYNQPEDRYCLAQSFEEGKGTSPSPEEARELYQAAAEQGLSVALKKLCSVALWGNGDTKINEEGVRKICCPGPDLFERLGFYITGSWCSGPIATARLNAAKPGQTI